MPSSTSPKGATFAPAPSGHDSIPAISSLTRPVYSEETSGGEERHVEARPRAQRGGGGEDAPEHAGEALRIGGGSTALIASSALVASGIATQQT